MTLATNRLPPNPTRRAARRDTASLGRAVAVGMNVQGRHAAHFHRAAP